MTTKQELASWLTPPKVDVASPPAIGQQATTTSALKTPQQPVVIAFLRHCGCPCKPQKQPTKNARLARPQLTRPIVAEKTFLRLREAATSHPNIHFIAVSHSTPEHTATWQQDIGGTNPANLEVVVDDQREIYGAWGLGVSSVWHVLSPWGLYDLYKLAKEEGIANRPTASGFRFQTGGAWAVDAKGKVVWGGVAAGANEIPDFAEAVEALGGGGAKEPVAVRASL